MTKASRKPNNLLELIGQAYDAAQDEKLWSALLSQIAEAFDSTSAVLLTQDLASGKPKILTYTENYDARSVGQYESYYYERDVWRERVLSKGIQGVFASADLIMDAEFERSEFYNDYQSKRGNTFYVLGAFLPVADDQALAAVIHRPRRFGNYNEEERRRATEFVPHWVRALQIRQRLAEADLQREAGLEALERCRIAAIVVTSDGAIIYANSEAETMLRKGDAIRSVAGRLVTFSQSQAERLAIVIRTSAETSSGRQGSAGGMMSIIRCGRLPVTIMIAPFRPAQRGIGAPLPAAILFARDPERSMTYVTTALRELFGLTPAQAIIASELASGRSLLSIATHHRLSLNTVRTHLKNMLAKTNTDRQSQFIALVLRSVAVMNSSGSS
jgi:DNA-binding CsgD family transcriptional regulator